MSCRSEKWKGHDYRKIEKYEADMQKGERECTSH